MKRRHLLLVGSGLFIIFLIYSYFVAREYLIQFDFDTTVRLQDNIPVRLDPFLSLFSLIGSFEITAIFVGILTLIVSIKKWRRIVIVVSFILFHVIEVLFKTIIDQVGPPYMFLRNTNEFNFPSAYISTDYFSYPSGHVGRTAFLVGLIGYIVWKSKLGKYWKLGLYVGLGIIFVIMFISRTSLGEHWVSDVVGGMLLGFSLAAFSIVFW